MQHKTQNTKHKTTQQKTMAMQDRHGYKYYKYRYGYKYYKTTEFATRTILIAT